MFPAFLHRTGRGLGGKSGEYGEKGLWVGIGFELLVRGGLGVAHFFGRRGEKWGVDEEVGHEEADGPVILGPMRASWREGTPRTPLTTGFWPENQCQETRSAHLRTGYLGGVQGT